jgi:hypothetical protein
MEVRGSTPTRAAAPPGHAAFGTAFDNLFRNDDSPPLDDHEGALAFDAYFGGHPDFEHALVLAYRIGKAVGNHAMSDPQAVPAEVVETLAIHYRIGTAATEVAMAPPPGRGVCAFFQEHADTPAFLLLLGSAFRHGYTAVWARSASRRDEEDEG